MYTIDTTDTAPAFEFEIDGDRYAVPLLSSISADRMRDLSRELAANPDSAGALLSERVRDLFDEFAPGAVSRLTYGVWAALAQEYVKAADLDAGK